MKKVLIISNGALSDSDSNGRTVANLFGTYDKDKLAQFCVYGNPDFSKCDNYYKVTDKDALKSLLTLKQCGGKVEKRQSEENIASTNLPKKRKTPLKILLREFAWKFGRWKGKKLNKWIHDFNPEVVFINLADNCFTINLAIKVAKKYKIPVVAFSTEDYYFKKENYLTNKPSLLYKILSHNLRKAYKRLEKYCVKCFLNTSLLKDLYANEFAFECDCSYCKSSMEYKPKFKVKENGDIKVSYLGNLGLNRHKALIEIGEALNQINSNIKLDIYGKTNNASIEEELNNCNGINYKGFVSYEQVTKIIYESDLLIHAEYSTVENNHDLKYAFSTKIADSVCSGTPLFAYANESLALSKFLIDNGCAFFESNKEELENALRKALFSEDDRRKVLENSKAVSERYFKNNSEVEEFIKVY
ncbi:MAG: glycosyltransferase family 4 protein [Clostridiales bacterium]|nr:glycosyltransferase family 4 protein [Clostridiales bacterium]